MGAEARYYDGVSAAARQAALRWVAEYLLVLDAAGREYTRWPRDRLAVGEADPDGVVALWCKGRLGRVMVQQAALPPSCAPRRASYRYARWPLAGVLALAAAFAVVAWVPRYGAALVPAGVEARFGETAESALLMHRHVCIDAAGQQALEQLEARLRHAAGLTRPVHIVVVDDPSINALALPGSRMIVMRGMIEHAGGPDALAGVMAHETAHIASRDPLEGLIRSAGISAIAAGLGIDFGLGNVSPLAGQLVRLSYSRDMERAADANGVAYLRASGLRSDGLAAFFASAAKREGAGGDGVPAFLSDHPDASERQAQNRGSPLGETALNETQWQAVRGFCRH
ncbi:M48 family metallopeptidase [Trinickia terrae]|uniref:M48 family metallopeptidase n=1 Tax=Trinickia terrae TaxID=2571161 RepID=A0A4U1HVZ8_9BURK|nr:M48 family metallopeptidase [Trinickia terrae]TKC85879.1 M48 family metallopeptidase [Trinickia terrae]